MIDWLEMSTVSKSAVSSYRLISNSVCTQRVAEGRSTQQARRKRTSEITKCSLGFLV